MSKCNSINYNFSYADSLVYDTYDKLLNRLYHLARYMLDPSQSVEEWITNNIDEVKKYITIPSSTEELILQIRYSKNIETGDNNVSLSPALADIDSEGVEQETERKRKVKLKDLDFKLFKDSRILSASHRRSFTKEITKAFLYYTANKRTSLVYTDALLNTSFMLYKNAQYKILANYIKNNINKEFNVEEGFIKENGDLNSEYIDSIFDEFEKYLNTKESWIDDLEELWFDFANNNFKDPKNPALIQAIYAYLNVKYFDLLLKEQLGDIITVSPRYLNNEVGHSYVNKDNTRTPIIKYFLGQDRSTAVKSWNIGEFRDALAELSKVANAVIGTLELYDATSSSHEKLSDSIEIAQIAMAWSLLKQSLLSTKSPEPEIILMLDYLQRANEEPNEYIPRLLQLLAKNATSNKVINVLLQNKLSAISLNTLYSIYKQVFDHNTPTALRRIEDILLTGLVLSTQNNLTDAKSFVKASLKQLARQDILISSLTSMASANYLLTLVDYTKTKTDYIDKTGRVSKNVFDKILSLNVEMGEMSLLERGLLIDSYDIKIKSYDQLEITLGKTDKFNGITYIISATNSKGDEPRGIFTGFLLLHIYKKLSDALLLELKKILNKYEIDTESFEDNYHSRNLIESIKEKIKQLENAGKESKDLKSVLNEIGDVIYDNNILKTSLGKINQKLILSGNTELLGFLRLIEDMLEISTTDRQGLNTLLYAIQNTNGLTLKDFLFPAIKIAASHRAMQLYQQHLLNDSEESKKELKEFMLGSLKISDFNNSDFKNTVQIVNGEKVLKAISNESCLQPYYTALSIIDGSAITSTTKNADGNSVANYRPTSLASKYYEELTELLNNKKSAAHKTIFVLNPELITGMGYDTQVMLSDGTKKTIKSFSTAELLHHHLKHNFLNSYLTAGTFQIQPTVYSDKTAFVTFLVNASGKIKVPSKDGKIEEKSIVELTPDEYERAYAYYISDYFNKSFNDTITQFSKLFKTVLGEEINSAELINAKLKNLSHSNLQEYILKYNSGLELLLDNFSHLIPNLELKFRQEITRYHLDNQEDISKLSVRNLIEAEIKEQIAKQKLKYLAEHNYSDSELLRLALETSYRKSGDHLELNELNYAYARHISSGRLLIKRFKEAKFAYVKELFNNGILFTYNDSIGDLDGIFKQIANNTNFTGGLSEKDYASTWTSHGKLILAKNGDVPIYTADQLTENSIINPILEKYFYVDNLLSANMKYALVGSEIADPDKTSHINMKDEFDITKDNSNKDPKSQDEIKYLKSLLPTTILYLQGLSIMDLGLKIGELLNKRYRAYEYENDLKDKDSWIGLYLNLNEDATDEEAERAYAEAKASFKKSSWTKQEEKYLTFLENKYLRIINKVIASCEGAQYKRNVIIPATMAAMATNSIVGVGKSTKMAIFEDIGAEVNNILGETDKVDAHDGSALRLPFLAILENGSLGDLAAGYELSKSIWHHMDPKSGTSLLAKWATFTITNALMRLSLKSTQQLHKLFKRMCNKRWNGKYDLCNSTKFRTYDDGKLNFIADVLGFINSDGLYYENNNLTYQILDFGYLNSLYYTKETDGSKYELGGADITHYCVTLFNNNSEEIRLRSYENESLNSFLERVNQFKLTLKVQKNNPLHTVDSIYELHEVMGGINSKEKIGPNSYRGSENSNFAVVAFMNNVIGNVDPNYEGMNLNHYELPLKSEMIGYAANKSAIKRGLFNINPKSAWYGDSELAYIELDNRNLGKQQDPDHEADEAEVTEMSQVIASLDAGGLTHGLAKLAFNTLGRLAAHGMQMQVETLALIISNKSSNEKPSQEIASEIYDIIGRTFFKRFLPRNQMDLSATLVNQIRSKFERTPQNKHGAIEDLTTDIEKLLPISDPNLFEQVTSAFTSAINGDALKRKYRGLGTVMVPGFDRALLFHFAGNSYGYTFDDILRKALSHADISKIKKQSAELAKKENNSTEKFYLTTRSRSLVKTKNSDNEYTLDLTKAKLYSISEKTNLLLAFSDTINIDDIVDVKNASENDISLIQELGFRKTQDGKFVKEILANNTRNNLIVAKYLEYELSKQMYIHSLTWFLPTDSVNVLDSEGNLLIENISLDNINDYFDFKWYFSKEFKTKLLEEFNTSGIGYKGDILRWIEDNWTNEELSDLFKQTIALKKKNKKLLKEGKNPELYKYIKFAILDNLIFLENITTPKNLRPQRITFQTNINGDRYNLYDLDLVVDLYYNEDEGDTDEEKEANNKLRRKKVLNAVDSIKDGGVVYINGREHTIIENTIVNEAAELMMSDVYESTFNQGGASLAQIHENYAPTKVLQLSIPNSDLFLMTKGDSLAISLQENELPKKLFKLDAFDEIILKVSTDFVIYSESDSGKPEYEIGRLIKTDYTYIDGVFKDQEGNNLANLSEYQFNNGIVYKKVYFIDKYIYTKDHQSQKVIKFNKQEIEQFYDFNTFVSDSIKAIALCRDYSYVQLNGQLNYANSELIVNLSESLQISNTRFDIWNDSLKSLGSFVKKTTKEANNTIQNVYEIEDAKNLTYKDYLEEFHKRTSKQTLRLFELTLYVVAARIPAQSLQSYMLMKVVGFIPVKTNECMVSHFLTWLQGSDYDIDKAYILGYYFSNSGHFYDWSPHFDYSSSKTAEASLLLPVPTNKKVKFALNQGLKISEKIKHISKLNEEIDLLTTMLKTKQLPTDLLKLLGIDASLHFEITNEAFDDYFAENDITDEAELQEIANEINANLFDYVDQIDISFIIETTFNNKKIKINLEGKRWVIDVDSIDFRTVKKFANYLLFIIPANLCNNIQIVSSKHNINKIETLQNLLTKAGFLIHKSAKEKGFLVKSVTDEINTKKAYKIRILADILAEIQNSSHNVVPIDSSDLTQEELDMIKKLIEDHESYNIAPDDYEYALKNNIAARMQLIVSNPRNVPLAYSPITMSSLRTLADNSPKGSLVSTLVSMNPATKAIMLRQNMDGKNVISISAVGEKVFMGLSYYTNEGIKSGDQTWLDRMLFKHKTTRIKGRYKGDPELCLLTSKTDICWEGTTEELKDHILLIEAIREEVKYEYRNSGLSPLEIEEKINKVIEQNLENATKADLMISLLLSAATDNAKELILSKINAGEKLAKVYLHLLILGYSMNDIYAFMTSDAVSLIDTLITDNIFNSSYTIPEHKAAEYIKKGFNIYRLSDNLKNYILASIGDYIKKLDIEDKPEKYDSLQEFLIWHMNLDNYNKILNALHQYENETNESISDLLFWLILKNLELGLKISKAKLGKSDIIKDLEEFSEVLNQANETSNLGSWMGLAKLVHPIYTEFMSKITSLENSLNRKHNFIKIPYSLNGTKKYFNGLYIRLEDSKTDNKEEDYAKEEACIRYIQLNPAYKDKAINIKETIRHAIDNGLLKWNSTEKSFEMDFSFEKFMTDSNYAKLATDLYDLVKSQYNILDIMMRVPLYKLAMVAWATALGYNNIASFKSLIVNYARKRLSSDGTPVKKSEISKLLTYADELMIMGFLKEHPVTFIVPKGLIIYTENYDRIPAPTELNITISSGADISTYKLWIENYVIPTIRHAYNDGTFILNGKTYTINQDNEFIRNLRYSQDGTTVLRKLDFQMQNVDANLGVGLKFLKLMKDFNVLDPEIRDLFLLYNLLVSKNAPGRDRMTLLFSKNLLNTILAQYLDYVAGLDMEIKSKTDEELTDYFIEHGYYDEDAYKKIAKEYNRNAKYHNGEKYIIQRDSNRIPRLYARLGRGRKAKYEELKSSAIFPWLSEDSKKNGTRMQNYLTDGVVNVSTLDKNNNVSILLANPTEDSLTKVLRYLTKTSKVLLELICK